MKAVKVAVLAASCNVLVASRGAPAAKPGMMALQDTLGNSRGYGLEFLENHF